MQAVINLSGEGTRLRPLSCTKCTAMLSVCDRSIVLRLLDFLKMHGVNEALVITGYMPDELKFHLEQNVNNIKLQYVSPWGGDGALRMCSHLLDDTFIYISKPVYADFNISDAVKLHQERNACVTILTKKGVNEGILSDKSGRVTRLEEKRMWNNLFGEQGSGVYILQRDIVNYMQYEGEVRLSDGVLPSLVRSGRGVYAKCIDGICEGIFDVASFMRANFSYMNNGKTINFNGIIVEKGAVVEKGAILEGPCYVGKNAHVYKGAKIGAYTSLGEDSVVLEGGNIKRSIIGKGCRIGKNVTLRGCVADDGVIIGESSTVYEQAIIGSHTKIAGSVLVKSFVKIWPEKVIEKGAIVSENIMWGQKKRLKLFEKGQIKGVVNVDITPMFCTLLGECAGALFEGAEVGVSTDGSPAGAMLRDSIVAGLLGYGCSVKDFGEQPLPITRRGVAFYMLQGALCINVYEKDGEDVAEITVITKNGFDIDENSREKLEESFEKRDFVYPESKNIKECEYLFEYKLYYLKSIVNYKQKKRNGMKILLSCHAPWGRRLIASALTDFSCTVSMYTPGLKDDLKNIKAFEDATVAGGFDIGFILDAKCEKLTIVANGTALNSNTYEVLTSLIVMKKYKGAEIYIPATASNAIEKLGEKYRCQVIRTKTPSGEIMRHMQGEEKYLSEQFVFRFDAVASVVLIMDYITDEKVSLEKLLSEVPRVNMAKEDVEMPPEKIESIMWDIQQAGIGKEESDGVKITFDKGWVMVIPDVEKEVFHVVSEGVNAEFAKELCDFGMEQILKMQN